MRISEEQFNKKFVETIFKIKNQIEKDRDIYGDAYVRFTDRSIEVLSPDKVILKISPKHKNE